MIRAEAGALGGGCLRARSVFRAHRVSTFRRRPQQEHLGRFMVNGRNRRRGNLLGDWPAQCCNQDGGAMTNAEQILLNCGTICAALTLTLIVGLLAAFALGS